MIYKTDLKIGRVFYWQDGGWHGCHVVTRWNKRYVYYRQYPMKKYNDYKEYRKPLSEFLEIHEKYPHKCSYGSYHNNIGDVLA